MPNVATKSRVGHALLVLAIAFPLFTTASFAKSPMVAGVASGLQVASLPIATVGQPYSATLFAGGGTAPYTWTGTGLPAGLSLNSSGMIGGTPASTDAIGVSSFTVQVRDSSKTPLSATANVSIIVSAAAAGLSINPTTLPPATVGQPYTEALMVQGGRAPYKWALGSGSATPAGLTLSSSGVLSGSATTATTTSGSDTFSVTVTDSSATPLKASANIGIAIQPGSKGVSIASLNLPPATVGAAYSAQLTAAGGVAPYSWTLAKGVTLPAGLSMSASGQVSGKPTAATPSSGFSFSVSVADSSSTPQVASAIISLEVNAASAGLQVDPINLPSATAGVAYSDTLSVKGGVAPYTWTAANVPDGLSLSSAGVLSGKPVTPSGSTGPTTFLVTVADSSPTPLKTTATLSIAISPGAAPLTIVNVNLPPATVSAPYSAQLQATGGTAPYKWQLGKSAALPAGLSMSAAGILSGTPTAATPATGSTVSVYVTDSSATPQTVNANVTVVVDSAQATGPALAVVSHKLAPAYLGASYSYQLAATGGTAPYTWAVAPGTTLPAGFKLSASGVLSGSATAAPSSANTPISVKVTDSSAQKNTVTGSAVLGIYAAAPSCSHDGSGNARLKGQYALAISGFDAFSGSHLHLLGNFAANGTGTLTAGSADANAPEWNAPESDTFAGTYSIGTDFSRGVFNLTDSNKDQSTLCFVAGQIGANGVATSGSVIRADESGQFLAGTFELQNSAAFTTASIKGNYTFGLQGLTVDSSGDPLRSAVAGYLTLDGTGKVTAGEADMSQERYSQTAPGQLVNQTETQVALAGTYKVAGTGRGTLELTTAGGGTVNFAFQVVSANELRLLEIDGVPSGETCCGSVLAGKALLQTASSFSNATLKGSSVFIENSVANAGTPQSGRDVEAGLLTFDGDGNVTVLSDENAAGTVQVANQGAATYTVDSVGRVTVQIPSTSNSHSQATGTGTGTAGNGGNNPPTFYLAGANQGFGVTSSLGVGFLEMFQRTAPAANFSGTFGVGTDWPATNAELQNGAVSISSNGAAAVVLDMNQYGVIAVDETETGTLPAGTNGRYLLTPAGQSAPQAAVYAVSPTMAFAIDISGSNSAPLLQLSSIESQSAASGK